jgi:hypothetical protein
MPRLILVGTVFAGTVVAVGATLWTLALLAERFGEWYGAALEVDL